MVKAAEEGRGGQVGGRWNGNYPRSLGYFWVISHFYFMSTVIHTYRIS